VRLVATLMPFKLRTVPSVMSASSVIHIVVWIKKFLFLDSAFHVPLKVSVPTLGQSTRPSNRKTSVKCT